MPAVVRPQAIQLRSSFYVLLQRIGVHIIRVHGIRIGFRSPEILFYCHTNKVLHLHSQLL